MCHRDRCDVAWRQVSRGQAWHHVSASCYERVILGVGVPGNGFRVREYWWSRILRIQAGHCLARS